MSKRSKSIEGKFGAFLKQYTRKAQAGQEPNDRQYDRKIEEKIKHMSPELLSEFMSGEGEVDLELEEKWLRAEPIDGVKYRPNVSVQIIKGLHHGQLGVVMSLVDIRPEPKYIVELSGGVIIVVFESQTIGL